MTIYPPAHMAPDTAAISHGDTPMQADQPTPLHRRPQLSPPPDAKRLPGDLPMQRREQETHCFRSWLALTRKAIGVVFETGVRTAREARGRASDGVQEGAQRPARVAGGMLTGLMIALAVSALGSGALAAPEDYRFEAVQREIKVNPRALVSLRLVHVPSGRLVDGATFIERGFDMGPGDMPWMGSIVVPHRSRKPGEYVFQVELVMEGGWAFRLRAWVPGESEPVEGTVHIEAVP